MNWRRIDSHTATCQHPASEGRVYQFQAAANAQEGQMQISISKTAVSMRMPAGLIIPPEMRDAVRDALESMSKTLRVIPASELTLMRKDGSRVAVFSSHAIVKRHGHPPEFFCIDIDDEHALLIPDPDHSNTKDRFSTATGIPYQNLINLYLPDCAREQRRLALTWKKYC